MPGGGGAPSLRDAWCCGQPTTVRITRKHHIAHPCDILLAGQAALSAAAVLTTADSATTAKHTIRLAKSSMSSCRSSSVAGRMAACDALTAACSRGGGPANAVLLGVPLGSRWKKLSIRPSCRLPPLPPAAASAAAATAAAAGAGWCAAPRLLCPRAARGASSSLLLSSIASTSNSLPLRASSTSTSVMASAEREHTSEGAHLACCSAELGAGLRGAARFFTQREQALKY